MKQYMFYETTSLTVSKKKSNSVVAILPLKPKIMLWINRLRSVSIDHTIRQVSVDPLHRFRNGNERNVSKRFGRDVAGDIGGDGLADHYEIISIKY